MVWIVKMIDKFVTQNNSREKYYCIWFCSTKKKALIKQIKIYIEALDRYSVDYNTNFDSHVYYSENELTIFKNKLPAYRLKSEDIRDNFKCVISKICLDTDNPSFICGSQFDDIFGF